MIMDKFYALLRKNISSLAFVLLLLLILTGNLGIVTSVAQSVILKTGLMNASTDILTNAEAFDYNFSVSDLKGNTINAEQFKGKVIFLNLWATWCGPCRAEMPTIQDLYNEVDHDKIVFIMLSLDKEGDEQKVVKYIQNKGFTFPVYTRTTALPALLRVPSIPTTFVISKEGKVISENVGTNNFNTKKFRTLLEENAK
jgi:thiol-disulfide isomerase/thioredoxin